MLRACLGSMVVLLVLLGSPGGAARAASPTNIGFVAMEGDNPDLREPGGWIAIDGGADNYGGNHVSVVEEGRTVGVILGGEAGDPTSGTRLDFTAPPGQVLEQKTYSPAYHRDSWDGAGIHDWRCDNTTGRFEVRDLHRSAGGAIDRLWIVFEYLCDSRLPLYDGEVRIGEPSTADRPLLTASLLSWPDEDIDRVPPTKGVRLLLAGGVSAVASHTDNPAFRSEVDKCYLVGETDGCSVSVHFAPPAPGSYSGTLTIEFSDGSTQTVALEGRANGGRTRALIRRTPGYYGDGSSTYDIKSADERLMPVFRPFDNSVTLRLYDGTGNYVTFVPPPGEQLAPGTYTHVDPGGATTGAQVYPVVQQAACFAGTGSFTIRELAWNADGTVGSLSADFDRACGGATVVGTVDYHATVAASSLLSEGQEQSPPATLPVTTPAMSYRPPGNVGLPTPGIAYVPPRTPMCTVPALIGRRFAVAKNMVKHAGCVVGSVRADKHLKPRLRDRLIVRRQSVRAGRYVRRGTKIALVLVKQR